MATEIFNKLVRDKIPEIIRNSGKSCETEILDDESYFAKLTEKLKEELNEAVKELENMNDEQAIKELADLEEVILAVVEAIGVSHESFELIREAKNTERGAFGGRILLKSVSDTE